jgi:hypothetical protein
MKSTEEMINIFKNMTFFDDEDYFEPYKDVKVNKIFGNLDTPAPTYTIFILTFKRAQLLKQAIDSALEQNGFKDYEIIIFDNDSDTDTETEKMMWEYHKKHKNIFYYKTTEWTYGSWNLSLSKTRTQWVSFLHDDDLLNPNFLSTVHEIRTRHPEAEGIAGKYEFFRYDSNRKQLISLSHGDYNNRKSKKIKNFLRKYKLIAPSKQRFEIKKYSIDHYYLGQGSYPPLAVMFKRENAIKMGGWKNPKYRGSEDFTFNVNYMLKYNLYYTDEILGKKREDENCDSLDKTQRYYMFLYHHFFYKNEEARSYLKYFDFEDWFILANNYFMAHLYCQLTQWELTQFNLYPDTFYRMWYEGDFLPIFNKYVKELKEKTPILDTYFYNKSHNVEWEGEGVFLDEKPQKEVKSIAK